MVLIIRPTLAKIDYKEGNILNNYLTFFSLSGLCGTTRHCPGSHSRHVSLHVEVVTLSFVYDFCHLFMLLEQKSKKGFFHCYEYVRTFIILSYERGSLSVDVCKIISNFLLCFGAGFCFFFLIRVGFN